MNNNMRDKLAETMELKDWAWLATFLIVIVWIIFALVQLVVWSTIGVSILSVVHPLAFWPVSILVSWFILYFLSEIK